MCFPHNDEHGQANSDNSSSYAPARTLIKRVLQMEGAAVQR
jgi:hypothetical protein